MKYSLQCQVWFHSTVPCTSSWACYWWYPWWNQSSFVSSPCFSYFQSESLLLPFHLLKGLFVRWHDRTATILSHSWCLRASQLWYQVSIVDWCYPQNHYSENWSWGWYRWQKWSSWANFHSNCSCFARYHQGNLQSYSDSMSRSFSHQSCFIVAPDSGLLQVWTQFAQCCLGSSRKLGSRDWWR